MIYVKYVEKKPVVASRSVNIYLILFIGVQQNTPIRQYMCIYVLLLQIYFLRHVSALTEPSSGWCNSRDFTCYECTFSLDSATHVPLSEQDMVELDTDWMLNCPICVWNQCLLRRELHGLHSLMEVYTHVSCIMPWIGSPWRWLSQKRNISEIV
jgi:hypothetical protein